jgi:hypothetical protein
MENYFATGSLAGVLSFPHRLVPGLLFKWVTDIAENPLGSSNPNPRSFPKLNSTRGGRKGGGAYRRRDCSGELAEGVGEVLTVTTMCGSPSRMVGVGRSACAGGGARRRRGVRPIQGEIDQSNGSESFTRDQGRCAREKLKNGSLESLVHARGRATKVRRGWSRASGEVLPGPRAWKASRATGRANRSAGVTWGDWSGLATTAEALAAMAGGKELAGAKEGWLAGDGEHGVKWGAPGDAL